MITELTITGFKALESCELKDLTLLTLIGGKNNSGKTTILEGFFLSLDWVPDALLKHLQWRGVEAFELNATSSWLPAFSGKDHKIQVKTRESDGKRLIYTMQLVDYDLAKNTSLNVMAPATTIHQSGGERLRINCTRASQLLLDATITIEGTPPTYRLNATKAELKPAAASFTSSRMRSSATEDATFFGALDLERRTAALINTLRIIEPNLDGLSVVALGQTSQIYADVRGLPRKLPSSMLGDGFSRLLSLLLKIEKFQNGYMLVDEIENGFHHSILRQIWIALHEACKRKNCQLIATTHSYECVTAFAEASEQNAAKDFSYFRLDRTSKGLKIVRYDSQAITTATENGLEVR